MKNSKWMRFLLIVVSVAMVLSLFACGDKGGKNDETTTAAPEGTTAAPENTTVAGGETTTVAGGETTVAGGETTTVAGGETTTVAGGEDTTVAGGEDTTVAGGEDTTVAGGEDTTVAPDDVYAGNWHASIDVFLADVDGNLGDNVLAGDFSAVDTVIASANTNNHRGTTIIDVANVEYPSVNASCLFFGVGWIAVDGYDVENFVCNVYDADGNVLKTVALGLSAAEEGVVNHVSNNMGYAAGTVAHRLTVNLEAELIDLSDYDGQTVKVVYSIDVATTEYTIDLIEIEVVVPEAPAGEDTTVGGGEDTTVAGGEDTTVAGGEDTTVAPEDPTLGTEENPIILEIDDKGAATVTVPAGKTVYYTGWFSGMNLSINGEDKGALTSANPRMPVVFSITNDGDAAADYAISITFPVGNMSNPAQLVIGENTAAIEAGNNMGYFFTYTAEKNGVLTLNFSSNVAGWIYAVNNMTINYYGDTQWSDSDPVVNPVVIEVAAGDEIQIMVNTYDPADEWNTPAGTVTVTAAIADHAAGYISGAMIAGSVALDQGYAAIRHGDGSVTVTSTKALADNAIPLTPYAISAKYAVIRYKATEAGSMYLYATTEGNDIGGCACITLNADGEWHNAIVDLTTVTGYTLGDVVKFLRLDVCESAEGQTITLASVTLCDDVSNLPKEVTNWHYSVDTFQYCVNSDYSDLQTIAGACTNNVMGSTIRTSVATYPEVTANYVLFAGGWLAVDGFDISAVNVNIYSEYGILMNTVACAPTPAEEGVVTHVAGMGYAAGTVAYRIGAPVIVDLTQYAGQTVTVVYELSLVDSEYTVKGISLTVHVPEAPAAEDTTAAPSEDTTEAPAEDTTAAPSEDTTEAPSEDTTEAPAEEVLIDATYSKAVPEQLTYITNNADYPNPSFYSDGGLKMNFVNMGMQTVAFEAKSSVKVTLVVNALNENSKSENGDTDAFTFYGLDANGEVVATATLNTLVVGDNEVTLAGEGIVAVKVIMTDYYNNGNKCCNVSVGGLKVVG